jgi:hypothetical protein
MKFCLYTSTLLSKCNIYFTLICSFTQHVSALISHHQVYLLSLELLPVLILLSRYILVLHFFNSHFWGVESILGPLGTSATSGLLYLPQVIVRAENLVEWILAWEAEVLWENLPQPQPQPHFVHHKSHLTRPGANPGRPGGKPATNRLSYDAALHCSLRLLTHYKFVYKFFV